MLNKIIAEGRPGYDKYIEEVVTEDLAQHWHKEIELTKEAMAEDNAETLQEKPYLKEAVAFENKLSDFDVDGPALYKKFKKLIENEFSKVFQFSELACFFAKDRSLDFFKNTEALKSALFDKIFPEYEKRCDVTNTSLENDPMRIQSKVKNDTLILPFAQSLAGGPVQGFMAIYSKKLFTEQDLEKAAYLQDMLDQIAEDCIEETDIPDYSR